MQLDGALLVQCTIKLHCPSGFHYDSVANKMPSNVSSEIAARGSVMESGLIIVNIGQPALQIGANSIHDAGALLHKHHMLIMIIGLKHCATKIGDPLSQVVQDTEQLYTASEQQTLQVKYVDSIDTRVCYCC
jgi:hypothetical protein